jgi:hypothetical protein
VHFYFCNHESEKYEIRDHSSEKFAQRILNMGAEDRELVNDLVFQVVYSEKK